MNVDWTHVKVYAINLSQEELDTLCSELDRMGMGVLGKDEDGVLWKIHNNISGYVSSYHGVHE